MFGIRFEGVNLGIKLQMVTFKYRIIVGCEVKVVNLR